ncbi:MAG: WecB/TagA/CpsF family glycosyltransferase [Methylobacteriaceae bacterium]|nr:WecB/TagA/CpsF family glycosyltransferase [Methylobacteriaceae bacterium]
MSLQLAAAPIATVDGQPINLATIDDAVARVIAAAKQAQDFTLFTLNLDHVVKRRHDADFRSAYRRATFVTADGAPIVRLARRQGARLDRTTGADLVLPVCTAAAQHAIPLHLFGSTEESLAKARSRLQSRFPRLDIRGAESPRQKFDPHSEDAAAAGTRIARSGARICLVALGAPKQEVFADRMMARGYGIGYLCVGAALDFISGEQQRAPRALQASGLEWFWRLAANPRRLALRYGRCAGVLADLAVLEPLRRRVPVRALNRSGL